MRAVTTTTRTLNCLFCLRKQTSFSFSLRQRFFSTSTRLAQTKQAPRRPRVKQTQTQPPHQKDPTSTQTHKTCTAYCHGEAYRWEEVRKYFEKNKDWYSISTLPRDAQDVLHVSTTCSKGDHVSTTCSKGDVFLFRQLGAFVCWDVPRHEVLFLNRLLMMCVDNRYALNHIEDEKEILNFVLTEEEDTALKDDVIHLNVALQSSEECVLEKLAFSQALALSVKLGMWETNLEEYFESLRDIPDFFHSGHSRRELQDSFIRFLPTWLGRRVNKGRNKAMTRNELTSKIGELVTIRHEINLYSDLLDTPDFYWSRDGLERLYNEVFHHYEISGRTRVMTKKLTYCSEVVEMLRSHLSDEHSHRLEVLIIILIAIEVLFEIVRMIREG